MSACQKRRTSATACAATWTGTAAEQQQGDPYAHLQEICGCMSLHVQHTQTQQRIVSVAAAAAMAFSGDAATVVTCLRLNP
jgi:hypothetical protein